MGRTNVCCTTAAGGKCGRAARETLSSAPRRYQYFLNVSGDDKGWGTGTTSGYAPNDYHGTATVGPPNGMGGECLFF